MSVISIIYGQMRELGYLPEKKEMTDEIDVIGSAIDHYGAEHQTIVAIEELSELQKELTKHIRGKANLDHIAEEMADVEIMLMQLYRIFGNKGKVEDWMDIKLKRLWDNVRPCDGDSCPIRWDE